MVDHIEVGKTYRLTKAIPTRCACGLVLEPGVYIQVEKETSPNRVLVGHGLTLTEMSFHKIRKSTLRMNCMLVE